MKKDLSFSYYLNKIFQSEAFNSFIPDKFLNEIKNKTIKIKFKNIKLEIILRILKVKWIFHHLSLLSGPPIRPLHILLLRLCSLYFIYKYQKELNSVDIVFIIVWEHKI